MRVRSGAACSVKIDELLDVSERRIMRFEGKVTCLMPEVG